MAGLSLNMGGQFGAMSGGYPSAATPDAAGVSAQGPTTIGQKAFGIRTGGAAGNVGAYSLLGIGGLAIAGLFWIWYSLPR